MLNAAERTSPVARVRAALVTDVTLVVDFENGRLLAVPLAWYPRLVYGTEEERREIEISPLVSTGFFSTRTSAWRGC